MTIETLARARRAQPFQPFTFRLADGRPIPVPRPESLGFNGKGQTAVVLDDGGGFEIVALPHVVSLTFEGQLAGQAGG